ncbi:hypothetical protein [Streptomyces sp. NBC_00459]|uniref:hypothetical protein n=1 Tax=Streptomyces sp. NBC_00459 TaxID=2975749 RepID=UPI002E18C4FF
MKHLLIFDVAAVAPPCLTLAAPDRLDPAMYAMARPVRALRPRPPVRRPGPRPRPMP